MDHVMRDVVE